MTNTPMMTETASETPSPPAARAAPRPRLGEELPIFCEKCGYNLHGLTQTRCEHCEILQFQCPECGHHQPINTLRPAAQRILGRLRAAGLVFLVFFKLNYFGWLLFAWFAMGVEFSRWYTYGAGSHADRARTETWFAFIIFAIPFGMVGRMLLLRWRSGGCVGVVLALLVMAAIISGEQFRSYIESGRNYGQGVNLMQIPLTYVAIATGVIIAFSSMAVWPIWVALTRAFLPKRVATALLEWQRSQSDKSASSLARI